LAINRANILRIIEDIAEEWERQGYSVKANLDGWSRPNKIEGLVPDLRATRGDKIIIGNNVIIGAGAIIMPGVIIEDNVKIAAGAVITKGKLLKKGKIYGGVPAKEIILNKKK